MKIKIINLDYIDEEEVNEFIEELNVKDIKYIKTKYTEKILIMYEE